MNTERMISFMKENGLKPEDMANAVGIDVSTWYRKMQRKGETFNMKEMNQIISAFNMSNSDAAAIFFNESLA